MNEYQNYVQFENKNKQINQKNKDELVLISTRRSDKYSETHDTGFGLNHADNLSAEYQLTD
jgi:hypothetical protein